MAANRLLIADASSMIFRGGSVRYPSNNTNGGLCYMTRTLLRKIRDLRPTHIVIAGDTEQSSETRRKIYPNYKRNRKPTPQIIKQQLHKAPEFFNDKLNMKFVYSNQCEADDIIHSIVADMHAEFAQIDILCDDKDLFPLLSNGEKLAIHRSTNQSEIIQVKNPATEVVPVTNFGVRPAQITDFLSLVGDASDGIPGCPTIGCKRATWLLKNYETIDSVYEHLDEIADKHSKPSWAKQLRNNRDIVYRARELIELRPVELDASIDDFIFDIHAIDCEHIREQLELFGLSHDCVSHLLDDIEQTKLKLMEITTLDSA